MNQVDKLRAIIREEIKRELNEGPKGAVIGYLVGVLADFFLSKKSKKQLPVKSREQLEKELKSKLTAKYDSDPEFRSIVDTLMSGKKIEF